MTALFHQATLTIELICLTRITEGFYKKKEIVIYFGYATYYSAQF